MPKILLTPQVASKLLTEASQGTLAALEIDRYKSGKNKGKHYADYTLGTSSQEHDALVHVTLTTILDNLNTGKDFNVKMNKKPNQSGFIRYESGVENV